MSTREIDRQVQTIWEAHWDRVDKASQGKHVLLVEGDDDKLTVEALFQFVDPFWETKAYVAVAGDRKKVLQRLEKNRSWFGLVDRDVWDSDDITKAEREHAGQLCATTGWCIENHFCDTALLQRSLGLGVDTLRSAVGAAFDGWLAYGSIWWVLQRLRERFAATLPTSECGHPTKDPCDDDATLRERLKPYALNLSDIGVERIIGQIRARKDYLRALPRRQRLEQGIHGKQFFREVIVPALNKVHAQHDAAKWRASVAGAWTRWPAYLVTFAKRLL